MGALAQWLIDRTSRRRVLIALAAFVLVQIAFGTAGSTPAVARVLDALPDAHLGYTGAELVELIAVLAADRTATYITYGFDLLNPVVGAAFVGLLLANLLVATGRQNTRWRILATLPFLAAGVDLLENATVLTLVSLYPSDVIADMAAPLQAISGTKWALHSTALVSMLVLGGMWFAGRRSRG